VLLFDLSDEWRLPAVNRLDSIAVKRFAVTDTRGPSIVTLCGVIPLLPRYDIFLVTIQDEGISSSI
jgi:hypothetical protein